MCWVDVLDEGCGGIFNVLSNSFLMSFTFSWCLRWYCCWCVWLVLWVAGGFLCRFLCISVLCLSRLCMISLGLVFFGFSTKDSQSLIEDLHFSCCEYFVAQVDYCVCGVRLLSWLVSGVLAGFMGNS